MSDNQCQICFEGKTKQEVKQETHNFKGYEITVNQPGLWCDTCNEAILSGSDLKSTREELEIFYAEVKLSIAKDIKKNRENLHMTQVEAARICGGGVNAFSRYEKGEILPSKSTINLLAILSKYPNLLEEINPDNKNAL